MKSVLEEIKNKNYSTITKKIQSFLEMQLKKTNSSGFIFGMSGGIDSAVIAYMCKETLSKKILAIIMPDSKITPKKETEDALNMIDKLGFEYKLIDIHPIINEYSKYLEPNDWAEGNLRARIRTNILYYYSNAKKLLVLGSSDRSEYEIGYFTKFGDGASDVAPIISLYKIQVRELAKFLNVPHNIIEKKSSPHLWKEHEAEKEIGASYEEIDSILYLYLDKKLTKEQITDMTKISPDIVMKVINLTKNSEHKRLPPQSPNL